MDQIEKVKAFRALHQKGSPLVLWNVWDAGSAKAVAEAGAPAVASGSWPVAAARGYADGQEMPMEVALRVAAQLVRAVDVPVSFDFEGGYAVDPAEVGENVARLIETGVVGLNFEDRVVGGTGLHEMAAHAERVAAVRAAADKAGVPFFINARSDVFFTGSDAPMEALMADAMARAKAYAEAGADGFFVPGLADLDAVKALCDAQSLPVNVIRTVGAPSVAEFTAAGVGRISHGPRPYVEAMKALTAAAAEGVAG